MLKELLSKLGASTRITVGVSVSPSLGLEMIEVDRLTGTVNKYAHKPLEYNFSTREIADYNQFQESLAELFEELEIPKKSNVILSVPNVYFGMINLPLLLTDEAVTNAIISEVEQSYIFKRQEPIVSWTENYSNLDTENRVLAYTAIQKPVMEGLIEACNEVGCKLVGVENSYASLLRALQYTGAAKEQMRENNTWNLMIIGQNSYSIISMVDRKIMDYYEEPLALKSFVDDEIYNAITTSAQLTLASLPANNLLIVSETDLVSAEVLSLKIPVECSVNFLECNKYTQNALQPANLNILQKLAMQITPEAIGVATSQFCDFPLKLNLIQNKEIDSDDLGLSMENPEYPRINIGNLEVELTPDFLKKIAIILGIVLILPMFGVSLWLKHGFLPQEQGKLNELNTKIQTTNDAIAKYSGGADSSFNLKTTMDKIIGQNKTKLAYYEALGMSIPNKLWVSYYSTNEAGKIDIQGKSTDVESVYTFYKNMKQLVNDSDIRLYKLEIASESIDDVISNTSSSPKYYQFEITNMTEAELKPPAAAGAAAQTGQPGQAGQTPQATTSQFQFGRSIAPPAGTANTPTTPATAPAPTPSSSATPAGGAKPLLPFTPQGSSDQVPQNLKKIDKF